MPHAAFSRYRSGFSLPRELHVESDVLSAEIALVWWRSWLFAGLSAHVPGPGDFFAFDVGDASVLVVRDDDGRLHAVHNTCRHRGMAVCDASAGTTRRWTCPYHQWSYARDGTLLGAPGMAPDFDASAHGLRRAAVEELCGLIYVWLGPDPEPFAPARAELQPALAPQGFDRARIAHAIDYEVRANWKVVWENNRECWHCHLGHPEYVQANFDVAPDTAATRARMQARNDDHARALGVALAEPEGPGIHAFPSPGRWWSVNRTPLVEGFVTESLDGAPVAPLMGDYPEYDVGTLRARTLPNFWCHASADHAVLTRLVPVSAELTRAGVLWLVDAEAVEGRDYDVDCLLPFWRLTSEQDWSLCERNHAGIRHPASTPGPYSPTREANLIAFADWYVDRMTAG